MYTTLDIKTEPEGFFDITARVQQAIRSEGITEGICTVFTPHTTCGITMNENARPGRPA